MYLFRLLAVDHAPTRHTCVLCLFILLLLLLLLTMATKKVPVRPLVLLRVGARQLQLPPQ